MKQEMDKRRRDYTLMRSIRDYGMGITFVCIGLYFAFAKKLTGTELITDKSLRYMLLALFSVYGIFRIYRGYAKKYFREDE